MTDVIDLFSNYQEAVVSLVTGMQSHAVFGEGIKDDALVPLFVN